MSIKEYKRKNVTPNNLYNSYLAKAISYPVSAIGNTAEKTGQAGSYILEFSEKLLYYGLALGFIFLILFILNKWRN